MSAMIERDSSEYLTVRVNGRLGANEWKNAQNLVAQMLETKSEVALLVILKQFEGWERGDWGDMTFQLAHDHQIRRVAIVCDKQWEDEAVLFAGKGLRKFEILHFLPSQIDAARSWLEARN